VKEPNKLNVIDFVISVLVKHEKELEKDLSKLEKIAKNLEKCDKNNSTEKLLPLYLRSSKKNEVSQI